jgi:hypothetical protein
MLGWSVDSREPSWPRTGLTGKAVTESNLSLRAPARITVAPVAASSAITSPGTPGCYVRLASTVAATSAAARRISFVQRFGPASIGSVIIQVDERVAGAWAQLAESVRVHGQQPLLEFAVGDVGDGESDAPRSVCVLYEGQSIWGDLAGVQYLPVR